ncbi:hypothetical protein IQ06DRAFT_298732 [Phaeosphaeriaceae sp. SRC1lsM3a]|nr:hypothetical protein IQ06DRAFT_298732 [Stagonospora sp. SRC1lsM3a]
MAVINRARLIALGLRNESIPMESFLGGGLPYVRLPFNCVSFWYSQEPYFRRLKGSE